MTADLPSTAAIITFGLGWLTSFLQLLINREPGAAMLRMHVLRARPCSR